MEALVDGGPGKKALEERPRPRGQDHGAGAGPWRRHGDRSGRLPATFQLCRDIVGPDGTIANIGAHGSRVDQHLERLWSQNSSVTTRLVDTVTTSTLLKTVQPRKIEPTKLITHRSKFDQVLADAYDTFARSAPRRALKVLIELN